MTSNWSKTMKGRILKSFEKVIAVVMYVIWGQIFGNGKVKWPPIGLKHWKVEYWSHYLSFDISHDMGYKKVIVVAMEFYLWVLYVQYTEFCFWYNLWCKRKKYCTISGSGSGSGSGTDNEKGRKKESYLF